MSNYLDENNNIDFGVGRMSDTDLEELDSKRKSSLSPIVDIEEIEKALENHKGKKYLEESLQKNEDIHKSKTNKIKHIIEQLKKEVEDKLTSKAYPVVSEYVETENVDMNKWLEAFKSIKFYENNGNDHFVAVANVTHDWEPLERINFYHWMKFYNSGEHLKYKKAQVGWYTNDNKPGYFLPLGEGQIERPSVKPDMNDIRSSELKDLSEVERKKLVEKQRKRLMSRLDSMEKLIRTDEGENLIGDQYEPIMDAIYLLKKQIQKMNKKTTSSTIYEDLIVRQSNSLKSRGFYKAAGLILKLADDKLPVEPVQDPNAPVDPSKQPVEPVPAPTPASPAGPTSSQNTMTQVAGPLTGDIAPTTVNNSVNPSSLPQKQEDLKHPAIADFLKSMQGDENTSDDDELFVSDSDLYSNLTHDSENPFDLIVEAQFTSEEPNITTTDVANVTEDNIEEPKIEETTTQAKDYDQVLDAVLSKVTVADVINKLESLSKIFKTREIPRQLAVVDMMLNALNLSSFFPVLSESLNKSLESNNYISIRIDEILSKLRGVVITDKVDMSGDNKDVNKPGIDHIQKQLAEKEQQEKARKENRKKQEIKEMGLSKEPSETPEIEIDEEPTEIVDEKPAAVPVPQAPATAPAAEPVKPQAQVAAPPRV